MRPGVLIACLLACSCSNGEQAKRHAEESSCYSAERDSFRADKAAIEKRYQQARDAGAATVEIVIERQRRIEQHCLASARCYGSTGTALSNLFEWCLDDERE